MLHVHSHLQPAVDESVVMDTTLQPGQLGSETSRNQPEKLEWLQDAGLGLFIHWSLDAQLGCVISHSLRRTMWSVIIRSCPKLWTSPVGISITWPG